jgi:hypothetical protein
VHINSHSTELKLAVLVKNWPKMVSVTVIRARGRWFVLVQKIRREDRETLNHAMHHVGCMISPELNVVQDRVQDNALNLTRFRG